MTNTSNLPVEAIEMEYPLLVESYGLIQDSGGAGKFRGGMGLRRVIRPLGHQTIFNGMGERFQHRPWGIFGGGPGASGRFALLEAGAVETPLDDKPASVSVGPEQAVIVETPGAGGYGPPGERDANQLEADAKSGKFSPAFIAEHYRNEQS